VILLTQDHSVVRGTFAINMLMLTTKHVTAYHNTCYCLPQNMLLLTTKHVNAYHKTCYCLQQNMLLLTTKHAIIIAVCIV